MTKKEKQIAVALAAGVLWWQKSQNKSGGPKVLSTTQFWQTGTSRDSEYLQGGVGDLLRELEGPLYTDPVPLDPVEPNWDIIQGVNKFL